MQISFCILTAKTMPSWTFNYKRLCLWKLLVIYHFYLSFRNNFQPEHLCPKSIYDVFWFQKPYNLLLPGECIRSKKTASISQHTITKKHILSARLTHIISQIHHRLKITPTLTTYQCIWAVGKCYFATAEHRRRNMFEQF